MIVGVISPSRVMFGRIRAQLPEGVEVVRLYSHENLVARCQEVGVQLLFYDLDAESGRTLSAARWRALGNEQGPAVIWIAHESSLDLQVKARRSGVMALLVSTEDMDERIAHISTVRLREIAPMAQDEVSVRTFGETVVTIRGKSVALTRTEYHILRLLIDHKGRFVSTQTITQAVWGADATERKDDLYVYMARLRDKLEEHPSRPTLIRSSRGFGYAFNGDVWLHHHFA